MVDIVPLKFCLLWSISIYNIMYFVFTSIIFIIFYPNNSLVDRLKSFKVKTFGHKNIYRIIIIKTLLFMLTTGSLIHKMSIWQDVMDVFE